MRINFQLVLAAACATLALCAPLQASAALFEDDEARRAILELRSRIDALNNRVDGKADKTTSLDLAGQNDQLRNEIARLRGQVEVLTNELSNEQRRQKDFYTDLDTRLRRMEPQKQTVDGREVLIDQSEQKSYDAALAQFKAGDYKNASTSFAGFVRSYPQSGYAAAAYYWLGSAHYALRDYRAAIAAHTTVVRSFPDNSKAPDALLNIASSYTELKDRANAKKAMDELMAKYPASAAAQTAKERQTPAR